MVQRRVFRVEQRGDVAEGAGDAQADALARHHELILEIRGLRAMFEPRRDEAAKIIEVFQAQIGEIHKLKAELDLMHAAIAQTKQEIAALHVTGFRGKEMRRVTDELDAVSAGTTFATEHILGAAEDVHAFATALAAGAASEHERELNRDIVERAVQIFEACNFHDLSGQRIAKVIATLKFIEERIVAMMEIWGGIEALGGVPPEAAAVRAGELRRGDGPRLADDAGHSSQDDIDALFS